MLPAQGLAEAEEAGVLRVEAGVLRFAHPLLAAEAYAEAGVDRRRAVHRTVAELVAEPEERAKHMALAAEGPDAAVAAALEQAAERARQRGAPDAAADLAERAAALTPTGDESAAMRRSLLAARYLLLAGDAGRARPMLEGLLRRARRRSDPSRGAQPARRGPPPHGRLGGRGIPVPGGTAPGTRRHPPPDRHQDRSRRRGLYHRAQLGSRRAAHLRGDGIRGGARRSSRSRRLSSATTQPGNTRRAMGSAEI